MDSNPIESNAEYIEVSAVAKILGVSTTTIYNKLSGEWAPYKHKIRNLTMVDLAALTEDQREKAREMLSKREDDVSNRVESDLNGFGDALKEQIEMLKTENSRLERLLEEANQRNGEKDAQITALTEQITTFTQQFADMLRDQQEITKAAQTLHAMQQLPAPNQEEEPERRRWFSRKKKKSRD